MAKLTDHCFFFFLCSGFTRDNKFAQWKGEYPIISTSSPSNGWPGMWISLEGGRDRSAEAGVGCGTWRAWLHLLGPDSWNVLDASCTAFVICMVCKWSENWLWLPIIYFFSSERIFETVYLSHASIPIFLGKVCFLFSWTLMLTFLWGHAIPGVKNALNIVSAHQKTCKEHATVTWSLENFWGAVTYLVRWGFLLPNKLVVLSGKGQRIIWDGPQH